NISYVLHSIVQDDWKFCSLISRFISLIVWNPRPFNVLPSPGKKRPSGGAKFGEYGILEYFLTSLTCRTSCTFSAPEIQTSQNRRGTKTPATSNKQATRTNWTDPIEIC
ncbi:hypothetical protein HN011_007922, partial [Eciton burchellii]